jgi:predicted nucleotidyltransferase
VLRFTALRRKLSEPLGSRVGLFAEATISPYLREKIKRKLRVIHEAR